VVDALASPLRRLRQVGTDGAAEGAEGTFWALRHVDFQVRPGEVVGIIGRNGAGKSTLLKVLSRITEPTEGCIRLRGRVASLLEVGTGFHPELTGRENVYLNGSILGMKRAEIARKFAEIVEFAEVEKFLDTPVKHYSSGMYVRLAFSVAAHLDPEVLIVDEVLAVGDSAFQAKCLGKMREVSAGGGRTVLFVSHNMVAIQQLCTSAILFAAGRVVDHGATDEVITRHLNNGLESEDGVFNLQDHSDFGPGKEPTIRRLEIRKADGTPTSRFHPEDAMVADLTLDAKAPIALPRLALAIEDSFGRRIMTTSSTFQGEPLPDIAGRRRVRCTIPRLGLGSGRYMLSVSVATKYTGLIDSLDNVAWFDVEWNNNYGNGEPYHSVYGPVLTPGSWELLA
jgi:lipopolysaccharide transport system ATP-binding protein